MDLRPPFLCTSTALITYPISHCTSVISQADGGCCITEGRPVNVFMIPVAITNECDDWCQITPNTILDNPLLMPSLARYIRGIRAVGLKEWWHQMQYIGDVKVGTLVGSDQCVIQFYNFRDSSHC